MIVFLIDYDCDDGATRSLDQRIEDTLRPHCQDLELQGSGMGFGRRDLEFWATSAEDIDFEEVLKPLLLKKLNVVVYEDEGDEDDDD